MTPQPPPESPITKRNRELCFEVMKRHSVFSRYPRVSEQVECLGLETGKLFPGGYNPTINSKGWLVYRFHSGSAATQLAVAQLGDNGAVLSNRPISIEGQSAEDARLFAFHDADCLTWVESNYKTWRDSKQTIPLRCVVKYAMFNGSAVGTAYQPKLPGNDWSSLQKNYVLYSIGTRVFCIYQCHPTHRVYEIVSCGEFVDAFETDGPRWSYGEIRGGTAPLPYEGKLLRFFHSKLNNEWLGGNYNHRYFVGAYTMSTEAPFKVERVSRKPIIYASELGTVKKSECSHFKPNVVFPAGAIETKGGFLLACGVNDCEPVLAKITPEQLNL